MPQTPNDTLAKLAEIHAFLLGERSLEGAHFGEKPEGEKGAFWWRKHLRAALTAQAPAVGEPVGLDEDDLHTIERAADLLEGYAEYIKAVKPDDLERHPYLPEIDLTANGLRAFASKAAQQAAQAPVGWVLVPEVATLSMCRAAHYGPLCAEEKMTDKDRHWLQEMWSAMLESRPQPEVKP